jgi:hypothetical protein
VRFGAQQERVEQAAFVHGDRDQLVRGRVVFAVGGGDHGEERVGEHGQGDPPVLGVPAADLALVESGQPFPVWKVVSSTRQRFPAIRTSTDSGVGVMAEGQVVGQFPGGRVQRAHERQVLSCAAHENAAAYPAPDPCRSNIRTTNARATHC